MKFFKKRLTIIYKCGMIITEREVIDMRERFWENLQYVTLVLLLVGQATVGSLFYLGQGVYLAANVISVARCFVLKRPMADKVKDCCCFALTVALLIIKYLGIRS